MGEFLENIACSGAECLSWILVFLNIMAVFYLVFCSFWKVTKIVRVVGWVWIGVLCSATIGILIFHTCIYTLLVTIFTIMMFMAILSVIFPPQKSEVRKKPRPNKRIVLIRNKPSHKNCVKLKPCEKKKSCEIEEVCIIKEEPCILEEVCVIKKPCVIKNPCVVKKTCVIEKPRVKNTRPKFSKNKKKFQPQYTKVRGINKNNMQKRVARVCTTLPNGFYISDVISARQRKFAPDVVVVKYFKKRRRK